MTYHSLQNYRLITLKHVHFGTPFFLTLFEQGLKLKLLRGPNEDLYSNLRAAL